MASSLRFVLSGLGLLQSDYVNFAVITCIVYDYVLTFSREVEYVWNRPWTLVSTLFVLVRYVGPGIFAISNLWGTSFIPGPAKVSWALQTTAQWASFVFFCAADAVMILRVWAMYNRSKLILRILLACYIGEVVALVISCIFYSIPGKFSVTTILILNVSYCAVASGTLTWDIVASIFQFIPATVMCILVIIQFIQQSLQMYRATKRWQLGQLMNLLVMEGALYFLFVLLWNLMVVRSVLGELPSGGWRAVVTSLVVYVPLPTLTPRFILDVRELYANNVRRRGGSGIDSGFGLSGLSVHNASRLSTIVFRRDGGLEHDEEIPMNEQTV